MRNLPIHAKMTQAQSPVILMTLRRMLKNHQWFIWSYVCTGVRNPTNTLGIRESMGGDFFQGGGGGKVSLNIIIMWGGVEINFCVMRRGVWLCTVPKVQRAHIQMTNVQGIRFQKHVVTLQVRNTCAAVVTEENLFWGVFKFITLLSLQIWQQRISQRQQQRQKNRCYQVLFFW